MQNALDKDFLGEIVASQQCEIAYAHLLCQLASGHHHNGGRQAPGLCDLALALGLHDRDIRLLSNLELKLTLRPHV